MPLYAYVTVWTHTPCSLVLPPTSAMTRAVHSSAYRGHRQGLHHRTTEELVTRSHPRRRPARSELLRAWRLATDAGYMKEAESAVTAVLCLDALSNRSLRPQSAVAVVPAQASCPSGGFRNFCCHRMCMSTDMHLRHCAELARDARHMTYPKYAAAALAIDNLKLNKCKTHRPWKLQERWDNQRSDVTAFQVRCTINKQLKTARSKAIPVGPRTSEQAHSLVASDHLQITQVEVAAPAWMFKEEQVD